MRFRAALCLALATLSVGAPTGAATSSWLGRYTVQPGDTLSAIAGRYDVSLRTLANANGLDLREPLPIGAVLHVPGGSLSTGWSGRYTVQPGDTLSAIAGRFGVSLQTLAGANRVDPVTPLLTGLVLTVPHAPSSGKRWPGRYRVVAGDTLGGIAAGYGVSVGTLAAVNGLDAATPLRVGVLLRVPRPPRAARLPDWPGRYRVVVGDTLGGIAAGYGVSVGTLAAVNGLDAAAPLPLGRVLRVPRSADTEGPAPRVRLPDWPGRYRVVVGDTLGGIAAGYGVSVGTLAAVNGLDAATPLRVGVLLRVPRPPRAARLPDWPGRYRVVVGDTLGGIAAGYGVSVGTLAAVNGMDAAAPLPVGVLLRVPRRAGAPIAAAPPRPAAPSAGWDGVYVVAPGDSLSAIALRFRVPLGELLAVNRVRPSALLLAGAHLRVPTGVSASLDLSRVSERDVYSQGSVGYDVSYPNCAAGAQATGGFAVVGLNKGRPFTNNPCFSSQWGVAAAPRGVYVNIAYGPPLFGQISSSCQLAGGAQSLTPGLQRAYAVGCSEAQAALARLADAQPSVIWVDVEPANTWSARRDLNAATIDGMLERLLLADPGTAVGVYSNASFWRRIVGSALTVSVPEWVATGAADLSTCATPFAAGPVWLTQGVGPLLDEDLSC